jgi:spore coat protein U-like protein
MSIHTCIYTGHQSDKALEGYIANTPTMKIAAAEALSFDAADRLKRIANVAPVSNQCALAPVINITINNSPGAVFNMRGIEK